VTIEPRGARERSCTPPTGDVMMRGGANPFCGGEGNSHAQHQGEARRSHTLVCFWNLAKPDESNQIKSLHEALFDQITSLHVALFGIWLNQTNQIKSNRCTKLFLEQGETIQERFAMEQGVGGDESPPTSLNISAIAAPFAATLGSKSDPMHSTPLSPPTPFPFSSPPSPPPPHAAAESSREHDPQKGSRMRCFGPATRARFAIRKAISGSMAVLDLTFLDLRA